MSVIDARSSDDVVVKATSEPAWADLGARLRGRFAGEGDPALIDAIVADECTRFDGARIRTFVPLLVERRVAERLRSERAVAAPSAQ